jgi:hypothetical protein
LEKAGYNVKLGDMKSFLPVDTNISASWGPEVLKKEFVFITPDAKAGPSDIQVSAGDPETFRQSVGTIVLISSDKQPIASGRIGFFETKN